MTRAGLGIVETAGMLGVSARTVRRYVKGEPKRIDPLKLDKLREITNARCPLIRPESFRFVDLFAGIGGLRRPFEDIGGMCVFTSEWDRFCKETYTANFPEPVDSPHLFAGDIRPYSENPGAVPEHDVLLAGFPCQPFSIAGVSKKNALGRPHGFLCETQGTLFYDLVTILDHHRPAAFLLENVKNLQRHDGGRTFATIMHALEKELGYSVSTRVIDSSPWVPQKRQRIFVVGFRKPTAFDFGELAIPAGPTPTLRTILDEQVDPKYTAQPTPVELPAGLQAETPAGGQRLRLLPVWTGRSGTHPIRPLLQGRLGDPDPAEWKASAAPDAAGVRAPDGLRKAGSGGLPDPGVRHPGLPPVRQRRGCTRRPRSGPAHAAPRP